MERQVRKKQEATFDDPFDRTLSHCRLWCAVEPGFHFMDTMLTPAETRRAALEELQQACAWHFCPGHYEIQSR